MLIAHRFAYSQIEALHPQCKTCTTPPPPPHPTPHAASPPKVRNAKPATTQASFRDLAPGFGQPSFEMQILMSYGLRASGYHVRGLGCLSLRCKYSIVTAYIPHHPTPHSDLLTPDTHVLLCVEPAHFLPRNCLGNCLQLSCNLLPLTLSGYLVWQEVHLLQLHPPHL